MLNGKVCERCGVIHSAPRFDISKALSKASNEMARDIDMKVFFELAHKLIPEKYDDRKNSDV